MYICDAVIPASTVLTSDRIVVKISMENITGVSQTATFRTEGSQHYSVGLTTLNQVVPNNAVTNVTGTAPIQSSGGTTPAISITQASGSTNGYLSSSDFAIFNAKQNAITLTTIGTSGAATLISNTLNIPTPSSVNIYNTDGTLTANRIVSLGTNNLRFNGSGNIIRFYQTNGTGSSSLIEQTLTQNMLNVGDTSGNTNIQQTPASITLQISDNISSLFGVNISSSGLTINNAYTFPIVDGTANQILKTNGAGVVSWVDGGSAIPQANTIYIDSVNGINATTGRGDINTPYLTPEYALGNITNTGTVTATTTSTSATLTAVSDTTNIKVGQYITGAGIPYGSIVVSKTSNTIVLSKACTASATITATWWTVYEVVLSGSFVATGNYYKHGFYINSKKLGGTISYGNQSLFTFTSNILIPFYLNLGNTYGTHANSVLINPNAFSGIDGFMDLGNYYSICTTVNLGTGSFTLSFTNLSIVCDMFDCRFGSISYINVTNNFTWNGNAYGLLGGLRYNAGYSDVTTKIVTPSSVLAITGGASGNINGTILGSYNLIGPVNIYANITGTTAIIDSGDGVRSVNIYGSLTVNTVTLSSSPSIVNGAIIGNVVVSGLSNSLGNNINGSINGTVTVNSGSIKYNGNQAGPHGTRLMTVVIAGGEFINSGIILLGGLTYTGAGKFTNNGYITTGNLTAVGASLIVNNNGTLINNGTIYYNKGINEFAPLISKSLGVFVNNGRLYSPTNLFVTYPVNTTPSKNITLGYAMSNGKINANSTSGTGIMNRMVVTSANIDTSVTIFDGTNTVTISVIGAGKTTSTITSEIVTQIQASILIYQCVGSFSGNQLVFVANTGVTPTFTSTTNISSIGTFSGGGGFIPTVLGGGSELLSIDYNF
jgi:hypothetical protein